MEVRYTTELTTAEDLYWLYESLGWNRFLQLSKEQLAQAMAGSFYVIYAYEADLLIGTGRVISDGVINAYISGVGVNPCYQSKGIGTEISKRLVEYCKSKSLHTQLLCEETLIPYYRRLGFETFTVGMKAQ